MTWLKTQFSKELWSPYVAGILLGVVGVLAVWLSNSLLGASGAFENLAGMIGKALTPGLVQDNIYFNFIMPPAFTWGVILLVGVFFGGMLGAFTSGTFKMRMNSRRRSGSASSARRPGSAGCWLSSARSSWNTPRASPAAAPAAWRSPAACCWPRRLSCSSPGCSPPASSPP